MFRIGTACIVSGASGSGKSCLVREILQNLDKFVDGEVTECLYYYGIPAEGLDLPHVKYIEGLPTAEDLLASKAPRIVVLDDSLEELTQDKAFITKLFSKIVRHQNILLFLILQQFFYLPRVARCNANVIIFLPSPADKLSIRNLARQIEPNNPGSIVAIYNDALSQERHGHLVINLDVKADPNLRYISRVTSDEPTVYQPIPKRRR